jgi:hypothetical protein
MIKKAVSFLIGSIVGALLVWYFGPRVIEQHQYWCDGVEVVITNK